MSLIHRTLTLGNYAFSAVALLLGIISLWAWSQAVLAWGTPGPYAEAMLWSLFAGMAFAVVIAIEWADNQGE